MTRTPFYYPRSVDADLLNAVRDWIETGQSSGWIAIASRPGRGNTSLLAHLHRELTAASLRGRVASLFVAGRSPRDIDAPEPDLQPVAAALFGFHVRMRDSVRVKLLRTLRHVGVLRCLAYAVLIIVLLGLITLAVGFFEYATQEVAGKYSWSWFAGFPEYVLTHEADVPLWLLLSLLTTALTALLTSLHRVVLSSAPERKPTEVEIERFKSVRDGSDAVEVLWDLAASQEAIVVLVDDAYALQLNEQLFLMELHRPPADKPALKRFREDRRVLIVTIEMIAASAHSGPWDTPKTPRRVTASITVPPFEVDEVAQIGRRQLGPAGDDNVRILEAAQHNIKALFEADAERQQESIAAAFNEAFEDDPEDALGYADVLAMIAVGGQDYETRDELGRWLRGKDDRLLFEHLAACGLEPAEASGDIVDRLKQSQLVRVSGRTFFYDEFGRLALRQYLANDSTAADRRRVLGRAHLYWFWYYSAKLRNPVTTATTLEELPHDSTHVKRAMWHIAELSQDFDGAVLDDVVVDSARRDEIRRAMAIVSATAAALYAQEGRLTESDDCAVEGMELLPDDAQWAPCLERLVRQLWNNYWVSARAMTRRHLASAVTQRQIESMPTWRIMRNVEDWFACAEAPSYPDIGDVDDPELKDWQELGAFLWRSRQTDGFLHDTLARTDADLPPLPRTGFALVGLLSLHLRASAEVLRDPMGSHQALEVWRERATIEVRRTGQLAAEAISWAGRGLYRHLRANEEVGRLVSAGMKLPETTDSTPEGLPDLAARVADNVGTGNDAIAAAECLERAIHLAMLLGLNGLALHAQYHLGWLNLLSGTAAAAESPDWWRRWDRRFANCLQLQEAHAGDLAARMDGWPIAQTTSLAWRLYAAPIHAIRYELFSRMTSTGSVQDVVFAAESVRDAHYPRIQQARWFARALRALSNYANTSEQLRTSVRMHLDWAHRVVLWPEAESFRDFRAIEHDQVDALMFAAQASRRLKEFDEADAILTEAEGLLRSTDRGDDDRAKDLDLWLRLQRLWLTNERGDQETYTAGLFALWPSLLPRHSVAAALLTSRARLERRQGVSDDVCAVGTVEAENPSIGLPAECLMRVHADVPLIETRLHQLLHLVWSACLPSSDDFAAAANRSWHRQNKFPEHLVTMMELAVEARRLTPSFVDLVPLLSLLCNHFATVQLEAETELRTLELLIRLDETGRQTWVATKRDALLRHRALLVREAVATAHASPSLVASASMVHKWLSDYEDDVAKGRSFSRRLSEVGWTAAQFQTQTEERRRALKAGGELALQGRHADVMAQIAHALPVTEQPWVRLDDLELMDLALKAARNIDGCDVSALIIQTRSLSLQYIRQLLDTVSEQDVRLLAAELLEAVEGPDIATTPLTAEIEAA